MQRAVQCRFMDQSTLVREAAVDLVGRFVLSRPELTSQYYEMLNERILVRLHTHSCTRALFEYSYPISLNTGLGVYFFYVTLTRH